jgi:hypothetical protein
MSTKALVQWIVFLGIFAMAARISMDTDTWWHLRAGEWILEHHRVPQQDYFSYTRLGADWKYPGWLVEVPMVAIYGAFGPGGLNVWTALMVTLAFVFIWKTLSGGPFLRAFVLVIAATVSSVYWAARPYLVTFVLSAVFLWILEDYYWRPSEAAVKRLWWLPVFMALWVNSHGGFLVGFILVGVYWFAQMINKFLREGFAWLVPKGDVTLRSLAGSAEWRLTWIGLLMLAAVCMNPAGANMLLYPFKTVSIQVLKDYIQEWQSPNFHLLSTQPFLWLLILVFGAVGISRRRIHLTDFLLIAGFSYLGMIAARNIALFALVAPSVITRHTAPITAGLTRLAGIRFSFDQPIEKKWGQINIALVCLLVLAVVAKVWLVFPRAVNQEAFRKFLPVRAVEYLKIEKPPGRLFNSYNWGAYLLWELPEYPVFVDGRTDLYNDEVIGEWLKVMRMEPGWEMILSRYSINLILVESNSTLGRQLATNAHWMAVFQDPTAIVYTRFGGR